MNILQIIGGYRERDKLIRLCQYVAKWLAGSGNSPWSKKLLTIAGELGACRVVLRLFDDLPMLSYTYDYGWGKKEGNAWLRYLQLLSNCANQLYFPIEHIAWCADKKLISRQSASWWTAGTVAWAVSLCTEILKALIRIVLKRRERTKLYKQIALEAAEDRESSEASKPIKQQIKLLKQQEMDDYLALIENTSDFINAINWLPAGYLWAETMSSSTSGFFGVISTLVKLYRMHSWRHS